MRRPEPREHTPNDRLLARTRQSIRFARRRAWLGVTDEGHDDFARRMERAAEDLIRQGDRDVEH